MLPAESVVKIYAICVLAMSVLTELEIILFTSVF